MFNSVSKIIAILLIVGMNWNGLAAVFGTYAMFSDTETSAGNTFTAGTLDFTAEHSWSYDSGSTCDPQTEICPGWGLTDTVSLATAGTLDFQYTISIVNATETASSTMPLCDYLTVNGMAMKSFASAPVQHSTSSAQALVFSLTGNDKDLQDQTCNFDYLIQGWQTDIAKYGQGFFVEKTISSSITSDPWLVEAPVVEVETGDEYEMEEEKAGGAVGETVVETETETGGDSGQTEDDTDIAADAEKEAEEKRVEEDLAEETGVADVKDQQPEGAEKPKEKAVEEPIIEAEAILTPDPVVETPEPAIIAGGNDGNGQGEGVKGAGGGDGGGSGDGGGAEGDAGGGSGSEGGQATEE